MDEEGLSFLKWEEWEHPLARTWANLVMFSMGISRVLGPGVSIINHDKNTCANAQVSEAEKLQYSIEVVVKTCPVDRL